MNTQNINIEIMLTENSSNLTLKKFSEFQNKQKVIFNEVLVHLDFKGAPPKFEFLMDFLKYIIDRNQSSRLITGFLFEFEDMLPFTGNIQCIRNDKYTCYRKE